MARALLPKGMPRPSGRERKIPASHCAEVRMRSTITKHEAIFFAVCTLVLSACEGAGPPTAPTIPLLARAAQPAILVGAGDIGDCDPASGDEATAALLDDVAGTVFTAGDNAYPNGSPTDYADCYQPTWGRHKERTYPSAGNHEYITPGAAGYFAYFGERAAPPFGYYSYNLGAWHIIVLNSNLEFIDDPFQEQWLRADLAANPSTCTLAYWHHPLFSSGKHGSHAMMRDIWQILYDANADVVLSAHDHSYERFAPQTPDGIADAKRGIREFVIGTGGHHDLYFFRQPLPNSEVRYNATHGILKLTLERKTYGWEFIPTSGAFTDSGSGRCH